jgi:transcription initiation factor TFIIIB Brf1 subunit/transcription initiation factor TFIIB
MDEFDKFDEEEIVGITNFINYKPSIQGCYHKNTIITEDTITCSDCGRVIADDNVCYDKDWKFQSGVSKAPNSRCSKKQEIKNIDADVLKLIIPPELKSRANDLFSLTTKGAIFRGVKRKALIYICIVEASKELSRDVNVYYLKDFFCLNENRHAISSAFKEYSIATNDISKMEPKYITPVELIPNILRAIGANDQQISDVLKIHALIDGKREQLRTSRPQSVAAGVVYYYCEKAEKQVDIEKIAEIAKISVLTIRRNAAEIEKAVATLSKISQHDLEQ